MKFDCVVMNPPYQDSSGNRGKGHTLWTKFIQNSFIFLKEEGYLCSVHPALWRQVNHEVGHTLKKKEIQYLEIHGIEDGQKIFGATTRYDWYILKNVDTESNRTSVKWQDGTFSDEELINLPFVPNYFFKKINGLLAKDDEEKCEVLHSYSSYETRRPWMSKDKTEKHIYPCFYYIPKNKKPKFRWSSTNKNGHFGIPKVVFPSGVWKSVDAFIDDKGEYGITEYCSAIVDDAENLENIYKAIRSKEFIEINEAMCMSKTELNWRALSLFRKDFWKEFV